MPLDVAELPNDVEKLKSIVIDLERRFVDMRTELSRERARAEHYWAQIEAFRRKVFGRSSETWSAEERRQQSLFNEAEQIAAEPSGEPAETVAVAAHQRVKRGRRPLPADLPREQIVHDIPEAEKVCGCGHALVRIGEESSEKLLIVPASWKVQRHVRPKYACPACEGENSGSAAVKIAPAPAQLLPKSIASPALAAFIAVSKFCDALPYYRQEKIYARLGMDISRQDLASWMIAVGRRIEPMVRLLREEIRSGPVVNIDETSVQVLDEPGRANTSSSSMWVFVGGPPGTKLICYQYHPSRSKRVPLDYLDGYRGFIQTDGYEGYGEVGRQPGILHAGCWAHARRKFFEAKTATKSTGAGSAEIAVSRIAMLYAVEKALRADTALSPEQFVEKRREKLLPHLDQFRAWLKERSLQVPPSLPLGQAIAYTLGEWDKLVRYLDSPHLTPDNNMCENAIRPFVLGRKNWLFSGSPAGAHASAAIYSLIETAKAAGVEPYLYLRYLFSNLPDSDDPADFKPYLPHAVAKADLLDFSRVRLY